MSFDSARILAGVGAILAGIGIFGYVIPSIVGVILFLIGMIELADYFKDSGLRSNVVNWFIFGLIALILLASTVFAAFVTVHVAPPLIHYPMTPSLRYPVITTSLVILIILIVVSAVFFILSAIYMRRAMDTMRNRTGEGLFDAGGLLYLIGAVLTFILVGIFIILVAWIIIGIALLSIKEPGKVSGGTTQ